MISANKSMLLLNFIWLEFKVIGGRGYDPKNRSPQGLIVSGVGILTEINGRCISPIIQIIDPKRPFGLKTPIFILLGY
jgi:hypothetical protein